ncbi:MAG: hypothetical protein Kow0067_08230 [Coriobacteriia bacterium]
MRRTAIGLVVLLLLGLSVGCASSGGTDGESDAGGSPDDDAPAVPFVAPGLAEDADGAVAYGTLVYRDLEGGFWAVADGLPEEVDETTPLVVVIANPGDLDDSFCAMKNDYVRVTGEMAEGVSIRMAGPEIEADSVVAVEVPAE